MGQSSISLQEPGLRQRTPARAGAANPLPGLQESSSSSSSEAQAGQGRGRSRNAEEDSGKRTHVGTTQTYLLLAAGRTKLFPDNEAR